MVLMFALAFPGSLAAQGGCKTLSPKFDWRAYKKIAVVGSCSAVNRALESLIVNYKLSPYELLERARLDYVAKEQGLILSPMMDPQELIRIGKLAGVDALVITGCEQSGRDPSASMRLVDATTGKVKVLYNDTYPSGRDAYEASRGAGAMAHQFYIAIGPRKVCADSPYGPIARTDGLIASD